MAASRALGDAAHASLTLPPDGGLRLRSMGSWIEKKMAPAPPLPLRAVAVDKLDHVLKAHAQVAAGMRAAEKAAKSATTSDGTKAALVAALYKEAETLGYYHLKLPSLPSFSKRAEPEYVADDERRRGRTTATSLAESLADPSREARLRRIFDAMDKDANGCVDSKEWGRAMAKPENLDMLRTFVLGPDATVEDVGRLFKALDVDASGAVDWDELVSAARAYLAAERAAKLCLSPEGVGQLKRLFDLIDKDGNGSVTSKEWGAAVGKPATRTLMMDFFGGINAGECGKMWHRIDKDRSGELSFDEFVAATAAYGARSRLQDMLAVNKSRAALRALFDALDTDGNGEIDSKEWGQAVSAHAATMAKFFGGDASSGLQSIGQAFRHIDADGSGTLTWDEFEQFASVR